MIDRSIIRQVKDTLGEIKKEIFPTMQDVFTRAQDLIKDIQTQDQLFDEGIKSTGISITPLYAESTKKRKTKLGQPTDRVTLKDTGDYYDSITVEAKTDRLIIMTNITYASFLTARYGDDVLGLTVENMTEIVNQLLIPEIEKRTLDIIDKNSL